MLYMPQRYDARTFLICVDSYDDSVPVGQFYYPYREEVSAFCGLTQLLLKIDQCMDVENVPQSFNTVRTFFPLTGFWPDECADTTPRAGKAATFALQLFFRRNASWQGSVTWLEKGKRENFRSVLELIFLMNSAITAKQMTLEQCYEEKYQSLERAE